MKLQIPHRNPVRSQIAATLGCCFCFVNRLPIVVSFLAVLGLSPHSALVDGSVENVLLHCQIMEMTTPGAERIAALLRSPTGQEEILSDHLVCGSGTRPLWELSSEASPFALDLTQGGKMAVAVFPKGVNRRTFQGEEFEKGYDIELAEAPDRTLVAGVDYAVACVGRPRESKQMTETTKNFLHKSLLSFGSRDGDHWLRASF